MTNTAPPDDRPTETDAHKNRAPKATSPADDQNSNEPLLTPAGDPAVATVPFIARGLFLLMISASLVITTVGLRAFGSLLSSFFLALVIVICVSPVRGWAKRRGLPGWAGSLLAFLLSVGVIVVVGVCVVLSIVQFVNYVRAESFGTSLADIQESITQYVARFGVTADQVDQAWSSVDLGSLAGRVAGYLTSVIGVVGTLATVIITMLFLTMDVPKFSKLFNTEVTSERPTLAAAMVEFAASTREYFKVNTVFGLGVALADLVVLWVMGVPLAPVWALLSFMSSFIPNIGFVLGMIPPALIALVEFGPLQALIVIVAYVVINTISDNGLKPKFVGDAVGLSATVTFFSLLFWSWVFGAVGALLAIPLTLFARAVLVDADPNGGWIRSIISLQTPDEIDAAADAIGVDDVGAADDDPANTTRDNAADTTVVPSVDAGDRSAG